MTFTPCRKTSDSFSQLHILAPVNLHVKEVLIQIRVPPN